MMGKLEVITGCMFSGKTTELLRRIEMAQIARKKTLAFKPEIDSRYSPKEIATHYGRRFPCFRVNTNFSLEELIKIPEEKMAEVIAFDEVHFFGPNLPALCETLVEQGKRVIVAGLDLNFRGEPFGPMPTLLALADEILKLTAVCRLCGAPATRTQRLLYGRPVTTGPEVKIGGLESYEPRCRQCWKKPEQISA